MLTFVLKQGVLLHSFVDLSGVVFFNVHSGSTLGLAITVNASPFTTANQVATFSADFSLVDCPALADFVDIIPAA